MLVRAGVALQMTGETVSFLPPSELFTDSLQGTQPLLGGGRLPLLPRLRDCAGFILAFPATDLIAEVLCLESAAPHALLLLQKIQSLFYGGSLFLRLW